MKTAEHPFQFCHRVAFRLSNASFHFHFLISRLRLQRQSTDFSQWFLKKLGLETLAASIS